MGINSEAKGTRILVNLSSLIICQAMQELLNKVPGEFQIIAAVSLDNVEHFEPDSILVDANTLALNHLSRWPAAKLILIDTGLTEENIISLLISRKLYGVISTSTDLPLFRKALQAIENGEVWIDNNKLKGLLRAQNSSLTAPSHETLSKKEREIVLLIAEGNKNKEISGRLSISEHTVKAHISHIFRKVHVTSRTQLVHLALSIRFPPLL